MTHHRAGDALHTPRGAESALLLTPAEAADRIRLSRRTLWTLTHRGEIRAIRIGRAVRYDEREIRRWIDLQGAKGGSDAS